MLRDGSIDCAFIEGPFDQGPTAATSCASSGLYASARPTTPAPAPSAASTSCSAGLFEEIKALA